MQSQIENLTLPEIEKILNNAPTFNREAPNQNETLYNPRTKNYISRGLFSALIQLDREDDCYHSTMPYDSSFYAECIFLTDLRAKILSR